MVPGSQARVKPIFPSDTSIDSRRPKCSMASAAFGALDEVVLVALRKARAPAM